MNNNINFNSHLSLNHTVDLNQKNQRSLKKNIIDFEELNPFKNEESEDEIRGMDKIKIEVRSSKSETSSGILNFFKKIFGIPILTTEEKDQIKAFNQNKILFKKDFKELFSYFDRLKKIEKKKENELPNQGSLNLVQARLNEQGLMLDRLKFTLDKMKKSSDTIYAISLKSKKYSSLSKELEKMDQQYRKLNDRLNINRSFFELEQFIVNYRDGIKNNFLRSFDAYSRVFNQKGIIERQLRESIEKRPELLRNKEVMRILKADELSPAAIKKLVKLSYPKMSPYINRLMNQLDLIKKGRLDGLKKQQKRIDNISREITRLNKFIEKKEKQLEKWNFFSYLLNFGSKDSVQRQVNFAKEKTIELTSKQSLIKFNEIELLYFKEKVNGKKAEKFMEKINQTVEHTQFLDSRKTIVKLLVKIEKLLEEIKEVKNDEIHNPIKEQELGATLGKYLSELAKSSKTAFFKYNVKPTKPYGEDITLMGHYLTQTFPSMKFSVKNLFDKIQVFAEENWDFKVNSLIANGFNQYDNEVASQANDVRKDSDEILIEDYNEIFGNRDKS